MGRTPEAAEVVAARSQEQLGQPCNLVVAEVVADRR
jgi:hypothetical protein